MGVRVALGACGADIVRLVLGEGVRVVLVGVVIGCGIALALGRVVASMLYDTSPRDPAVLGAVSLVLVGVVGGRVPSPGVARDADRSHRGATGGVRHRIESA